MVWLGPFETLVNHATELAACAACLFHGVPHDFPAGGRLLSGQRDAWMDWS